MDQIKFSFPKGKKRSIKRFCKILSTASYHPEKSLSNEDIISIYGLPFRSTAIIKSIGVEKRHIAEDSMADSDLLNISASDCLGKYGLAPDNLSRIIVNKYYGDNLLPMTASKLQAKLGCSTAVHAFDIDGGVTSFLHSFDAASRFINTGDEFILVASGGINYRLISKTDPRTAFLFGDASAAILFGCCEEQHILSSYFYSNYEYYDLATSISPLTVVDMGVSPINNDYSQLLFDTYRMDSWKIAEGFYRQAVKAVSDNLLDESGLTMDDIDLVLVTENNRRIWELSLETLGISEEKSLSLLRSCGNTMSSMLPTLLDYGFKTEKIQTGMIIMLISHGEGMSGGGLIYKV